MKEIREYLMRRVVILLNERGRVKCKAAVWALKSKHFEYNEFVLLSVDWNGFMCYSSED